MDDRQSLVTSREDLSDGIFRSSYVRRLFDEMSSTYPRVNAVASLGFCGRWRDRCVTAARIEPGDVVCDLMSGRGELWPRIARRIGRSGSIVGVDLSPRMCSLAHDTASALSSTHIAVINADALDAPLPDGSVDVIVSSFGLKTLDLAQTRRLAAEVRRLLRPDGRFSFVEISVPRNRVLRMTYVLYLCRVVPLVGTLLSANVDTYRMLGVYTRTFDACHRVAAIFKEAGLIVEIQHYLLGCATGVSGWRA